MKSSFKKNFFATIIYFIAHEPIYPLIHKIKQRFKKNLSYDKKTLEIADNINSWFDSKLFTGKLSSKLEGNILIESSYLDPGSNYNSLLTFQLINSASKNSKAFILVNHLSDPVIEFWRKCHGAAIICFDSQISWGLRLQCIKDALVQFINCKLSHYTGFTCLIDGTNIGDLVIEDIIRQTGIVTVQQKSTVLFAAMYSAALKFRMHKKILKKYEIKQVIATHNVYIYFGTLLKACSGLATFWMWGGTMPFALHRTLPSDNSSTVRAFHVTQEDLDLILGLGRGWIDQEFAKFMDAELSGKYTRFYDDVTVYQRAEIRTKDDFIQLYKDFMKPNRKNIFVMSHVLVDAVNVSPWRIYSDYYVWLKETLSTLAENKQCNIFVKPHPSDFLYTSDTSAGQVVREVNKIMGSNICFLDKQIANPFVYSFADAFVTCSGTIAMQGPCFGIPTVTTAATSGELAGTTYTPRTEQEYKNMLLSIDKLSKPSSEQIHTAKALYLWLAYFCFSKSNLNVFNSTVSDPVASNLLMKILKNLESIKNVEKDELCFNFIENYVNRNRRQQVSFSCFPKNDSPSVTL